MSDAKINDMWVMLIALCNERGIVPSTLPGIMMPLSSYENILPTIQSTSSPGIPMSSLTLSDAHSVASSLSSVSDNPPLSGKYLYYYVPLNTRL
jgi:hypothetical protein